jgi:hypothetical protein
VPREIQGVSLPLEDEAERVSRRGRAILIAVMASVAAIVLGLVLFAATHS